MRLIPRVGRDGPWLHVDDRFTRGLTIGALIGAAIAGSTLWSRLRASRHRPRASVAPHEVSGITR